MKNIVRSLRSLKEKTLAQKLGKLSKAGRSDEDKKLENQENIIESFLEVDDNLTDIYTENIKYSFFGLSSSFDDIESDFEEVLFPHLKKMKSKPNVYNEDTKKLVKDIYTLYNLYFKAIRNNSKVLQKTTNTFRKQLGKILSNNFEN